MLVCLLGGLSSCDTGNDQSDYITEQYMQNCYAQVTDKMTGDKTYCSGVSFYIQLNYTQIKATISFAGLKIGTNAIQTTTLENLPWSRDEQTTWATISVPAPATSGTNRVSAFNMKWLDRLDFGQSLNQVNLYAPAFVFSFTLDDRYEVVGSIQPQIMVGETVSTPEGGQGFSSTTPVYTVIYDFSKMTASIGITGAMFAANMPAQNMVFPDLPFTMDSRGYITIESADFIPTINNTPQPEFPISDLTAHINPAIGMTLDFKCNVRKAAMFSVSADVDFTSYK